MIVSYGLREIDSKALNTDWREEYRLIPTAGESAGHKDCLDEEMKTTETEDNPSGEEVEGSILGNY